jgi:hypothetical protein
VQREKRGKKDKKKVKEVTTDAQIKKEKVATNARIKKSAHLRLKLCFFCFTYVPFVVKKPLRTLRLRQ